MHLTQTCKQFQLRKHLVPGFTLDRFRSFLVSSGVNNLLKHPPVGALILTRRNGDNHGNGSRKWKLPSGYKTNIMIHNPITKHKVPLVLKNKSFATWYMCGPTVYDSAHLGHACCYVRFDVVRRILEQFFGINVVMAMSVTDVDDKIINKAKQRNEDFSSISHQYEAEFWEDMRVLNVIPPNTPLKVTRHIEEIISFTSRLIEVGKAYTAGDGSVYFDTCSYGNYGKFMSFLPEEAENYSESRNVDQSVRYKRSPVDFALWKASPNADEPGWPSPWGRGRPGWHIECSAMASKLFGPTVDLHSGGVDLIFPHHENEEAQSCAHHGVSQWVNYWIHSGHLHLKGQQKMSKSLKNTMSIREFLSNHTANQFRIFCLMSHYRSGVAYTEETMGNAVATMSKIESFLADASAYIHGKKQPVYLDINELDKAVNQFEEKMLSSFADDFNTPSAMNALIELISYCNKILNPSSKLSKANLNLESNSTAPIAAVAIMIARTLEKLGIDLKYYEISRSHDSPNEMGSAMDWSNLLDMSVEFRNEIRCLTINELKLSKDDVSREYVNKILQACDGYRKNMASKGIAVKDHGKTSSWSIAEVDSKPTR
ncbi:probable cysteine--tRNA ligase, mitochondrial [Ischnura elegans]|uniref:probable cysteine--tRNA ligase, mitochondrial n=1 Tax=Ischnura elegans TaxID=197161 RepID=UPI001ED87D0A|nr:probable cysteine--tRNA ligase, mitochondrial [Ischnura elegans]